MAYGPPARHRDVVADHRHERQHDQHGEETRHDEVAHGIDRHDLERLNLLGDFHGPEFRRDRGTASANHDHTDEQWAQLLQDGDANQMGNRG